MSVCVHHSMWCGQRDHKGIRSPGMRVTMWVTMWLSRTEPGSSAKIASAFSSWVVVSPVHTLNLSSCFILRSPWTKNSCWLWLPTEARGVQRGKMPSITQRDLDLNLADLQTSALIIVVYYFLFIYYLLENFSCFYLFGKGRYEYYGACVEVRGEPKMISFLLPGCLTEVSRLAVAPLLSRPSCQMIMYF